MGLKKPSAGEDNIPLSCISEAVSLLPGAVGSAIWVFFCPQGMYNS